MQKTRIEWTDYTWNPIKGICPVGCWYCYARKMYKRFGWKPEIYLDSQNLLSPHDIKRPSKIFVCSTFELFNPITKVEYGWDHTDFGTMRDAIFDVIKSNPQHTFQILTKTPQNIDRSMPHNVWLGFTITNQQDIYERTPYIHNAKAGVLFLSVEPYLESIGVLPNVDWIIIGRLTGHGHKHDPSRDMIKRLSETCSHNGIPVFMKDNLRDIWGRWLRREFPE